MLFAFSIMAHQLSIEPEIICDGSPVISGNRIVNIDYLLKETLQVQHQHSRKCTFGLLKFCHEKRLGLMSIISLKCSHCENLFIIHTDKPCNNEEVAPLAATPVINTWFVWGTLTRGNTYTNVKDIMSCLDIPVMNHSQFLKIEEKLGDGWKNTLWSCMEQAGKEELNLAIEKQQFDENGIPWITVHCDGAWSRRSYGHSYKALSGTVSIL